MPNVITGHNDVLIVLRATNGGWCVYAGGPDNTATEILESSPAAALSDDEGLIEWFAEELALPAPELQARPPKPWPEAKPAEHGAPPVAGDDLVKHMVDRFLSWRLPENFSPDGGIRFIPVFNKGTDAEFKSEPSGTNLFDAVQAEAMVRHMLVGLPEAQDTQPAARDIGQLAAEHMTAVLTLADVRKALKPFAAHAQECRDCPDREYLSIQAVPDGYEILNFGELRTLLRAAGMFTDEMQAPAPNPGPAAAAGDTPPSPAATDSDEVDQLKLIDVGARDEDEGCPKGDPDCLSLDGENHDMCERPG